MIKNPSTKIDNLDGLLKKMKNCTNLSVKMKVITGFLFLLHQILALIFTYMSYEGSSFFTGQNVQNSNLQNLVAILETTRQQYVIHFVTILT